MAESSIEGVSWQDVEEFVKSVADYYEHDTITGMYGIPRGGSILAVMISHEMDIPCLMAPCKGCLVVDDISDTGLTLLHYKSKGYQIATMFSHPQTKVVPDFSMKIKSDGWIVFPWEKTVSNVVSSNQR